MKTDFSIPVATAEFSKFAGILGAALSQHHLSGFEIAQLEFTNKIYYLLSTYYVRENIPSILHVPHHIIPTRPFGENSAIVSMLQ